MKKRGIIFLAIVIAISLMSWAAPNARAEEPVGASISAEEFPIGGYASTSLGAACDFGWDGAGVWSEKSEYDPTEDFINYSQFINYGATSRYTVYFYLYDPASSLVWSDSTTGTLLGEYYVTWTIQLPPLGAWEAGNWRFCSEVIPVSCPLLAKKCCTNKVIGEPDIRLDKNHLDFEFTVGASSGMGHPASAVEAATFATADSSCNSYPVCETCSATSDGSNCEQNPQAGTGIEKQSTASEQSQLEAIRKAIEEKGARWEAGITSVSGLSLEAKKRLCGAKLGSIPEDVETVTPSLDLATLPTAFDWRDKDGIDWMTSIKDQLPCGTCWVFGTLGALEAAINIYNNDSNIDMDLSEQMVLSCSDNIEYTPTCTGGDPQDALDYLRDFGVANEACFPYQCPAYNPSPGDECTNQVPCNCCSDWAGKAWKVTHAQVSPDITDEYKAALLEYGPLVVLMKVPDDFFFYKGGIYEPVLESEEWVEAFPYGQEPNHCITLVGYNDAGGYWVIKNSWSRDWGEEGYGKILYGNIEKYGYTFAVTSVDGPDNCKSVTVFNAGNAGLDVTNVAIGYNVGEPTGWLDAERKSFSLIPLHSEGITVWVDTSGLSPGEYHGTLNIISNDPDETPAPVTVTLKLEAPVNNPPQLSNPSVQPPSGVPSTDFYYYANYYDSDGDSPNIKRVYIDGTPYTMSLQSGSASNGAYRYGPKNLAVGSHNYYFYFEDGKGGTARLPTSGAYSGPTVSPPSPGELHVGPGQPYATIQAAIDAASDGDTIIVHEGTHDAFTVEDKNNISIIGQDGVAVNDANMFVDGGEWWVMALVMNSTNINIEGIVFDGGEIEVGMLEGIAYGDSTGSITGGAVRNIVGRDMAMGVCIWGGEEGSTAVDVSHLTVENCGMGIMVSNAEANLDRCSIKGRAPNGGYGIEAIDNAQVTMENCVICDCWKEAPEYGEAGIGVMIALPEEYEAIYGIVDERPCTAEIRGSTISNNNGGVVVYDDGNLTANFNNIAGNDLLGLYNSAIEEVDATNNWWGNASGPSGAGPGTGDGVSDNVNYNPWLDSPVSDILAYYRGLGVNPDVVETTDLLKAIGDWANGEIPPDFSQAITTMQLLQLIGEWASG